MIQVQTNMTGSTKMRHVLNYYDADLVLACPYCGDDKSHSETGCCGESSAHFEAGYIIDDVFHPETDVQIVRPILDMIRFEIFNSYRRSVNLRRIKERIKLRLCKLYDGNGLCLTLRQKSGFQWSKLDCLVLKQLHSFPVFYTPPKIAQKMRLNALAVQKKLAAGIPLTNDDFKI